MARALERPPLRRRALDEVGQVGGSADRREREPVAERFERTRLPVHVVDKLRQRVSLSQAAVLVDIFVAAGKGNGLERHEADLVGVLERELHDAPHLVVVDRPHDGDDEYDVDPGLVEILDRSELDLEEVGHLPVRIRLLAHAVELQVRDAKSGVGGRASKAGILREAHAVGGRLDAEVAGLARVGHALEKDRRQRRFAARELDRDLAPGPQGHCVVDEFLDVFERQLVNIPHLVGVHEARVAHHVAAVGEVDRQDAAAAVADGGRSVIVKRFRR